MTNLKGFKLYMLDVHVDAVKVTTVYVSDYDGVRINKPHNRLWWTRGSERQAVLIKDLSIAFIQFGVVIVKNRQVMISF